VPVYDWLASSLKPYAEHLVLGPDARLPAWFRREPLTALVAQGVAATAPAHDRHRLWNLIVLEHWFREWLT
jgi:asparagine synthase (glutamine-hydrolysing)